MENPDLSGKSGFLSPLKVLNAARRAVPAVKFALGVAGVAAAGAIVTGLIGRGRAAVFILGGMLVAMILLFVFSRLISSKDPSITTAGMVLLWTVTLFFCLFLVFTATAVAVQKPAAWANVLGISVQPPAPSPIGQLAAKIDYSDVSRNTQAVDSLVGLAMTASDDKQKNEAATILAGKAKYHPTVEFDTASRTIKKSVFAGLIKLRNHDLRKDFLDDPLTDLDMVGLDFSNVNASGVKFTKSFLIGSNFRGADLRETDFSGTYLRNVLFQGASLAGATFSDADWFDAEGFTAEQFSTLNRKGLKSCPADSKGRYSLQLFIKFANSQYAVNYEDWGDDEQKGAAQFWAEYMRPGGLCAAAKSIAQDAAR
jgi:hypothetical protein